MKISRLFSPPAHGALEFGAGVAMMLAPAALGFSVIALIISASLGAILTGMALTLNAPGRETGRGVMSRRAAVTAHGHFDTVFVLVTAIAALALAAAHQPRAVIFLAVIVVLQAGLNVSTRYAVGD